MCREATEAGKETAWLPQEVMNSPAVEPMVVEGQDPNLPHAEETKEVAHLKEGQEDQLGT